MDKAYIYKGVPPAGHEGLAKAEQGITHPVPQLREVHPRSTYRPMDQKKDSTAI